MEAETRATLLIDWLEVLREGLVKPHKKQDGDECCNDSFVIRDTKDFRDTILDINSELRQILKVPVNKD
jgi:hypothetical protein